MIVRPIFLLSLVVRRHKALKPMTLIFDEPSDDEGCLPAGLATCDRTLVMGLFGLARRRKLIGPY